MEQCVCFLIVASLTHVSHTAPCFPRSDLSCYSLAFEACHRSCLDLVILISQHAKQYTTLNYGYTADTNQVNQVWLISAHVVVFRPHDRHLKYCPVEQIRHTIIIRYDSGGADAASLTTV